MAAQGINTGVAVQVDLKKVGLNLSVLAEINVTQHTQKKPWPNSWSACMPHRKSCMATSLRDGHDALSIMGQDMDVYVHVLMQTLFKLAAVAQVRGGIVLRDLKQGMGLPL